MKFINYAHRGASTYCPENTMLSFYTGVYMGANGIETDVQRTKDGILVLFHDDTITRVTGKEGKISDYTYEELLTFDVNTGALSDKIPTFESFLRAFSHFDLTFAIELKVADVEKDTADLIFKYGLEDRVVITSFSFDYIKKMKEIAPQLRIGYLTSKTDEETTRSLLELGAYEICPKAETITSELVEYWHSLGLGVRAWGVFNTDIMKMAFDLGVDGMTVNFPDKLVCLMNS
ncbi:MAG: glycerophosphodiester phosphodiesterase [Clostridia bacterium]|nr:glycerophosphodiester phosphodiesterase [Clostridia bacterium]